MPLTADELSDINNMALETYLDKGKIHKQDVANKPMLAAFQEKAGQFPGGKENVSFLVGSGYGGGTLQTATALPGTWADIPGAASGYTTPASDAVRFFRVRQ